MPRAIFVRTLTSEEKEGLLCRARSRTEAARDVERAQMILLSHEGMTVSAIAAACQRAGRDPGGDEWARYSGLVQSREATRTDTYG